MKAGSIILQGAMIIAGQLNPQMRFSATIQS